MSGPPNWNPPLQTSSVRFPRKAVETPQIPPNTTARPRPGAPFQPVYPNPITQIPAITPEITGSGKILDKVYLLNSGTGEAVPYNVTRQTVRGVPTPVVKTVATSELYIVFGVDFAYRMSGTDHFVFAFTNTNTNEVTIKNYQPAPQYLVGNLDPGVLYTLTVSPNVNGITYPASPPTNPFAVSAISEKNVELQGVTLSGGDRSAYILFTGSIPAPPLALAVTNIAIDDNFGNAQLRCNVISPPGVVNAGYVFISNLTNGSSYIFTATPYSVSPDGIYEYGRPTNLPPYIPGPPSDLFFNSISANTTTAFLNTAYTTLVHPTPVSNIVNVHQSTFDTLYSFALQPSNVVKDLSQAYAGFTTLSSLFTAADILTLQSTISANPGIVQVDITDNTGLWYSFPLASVSGGGIGYVFENSNFTKTQSLYTTASVSYTLLFRQINLGTQVCSAVYAPPETAFGFENLFQSNYTLVGRNYANGLPSIRTNYATVAVGSALAPINITGVSGSHIISLSFTGYNPARINPGPKPTFFSYSDNFGNTYTSINSNIVINGLTDSSAYTFTIQGFANGVYGNAAQYSITPGVRPPTSLSVLAVSNYDVTLSFSPALGGADFYSVETQNGAAQSASASPYKIQNLSADVSYYFSALSYSYTSAVYSISSSVSANLIQEVSSSYAQFLISPSGFPYASTIQQGRTQFVPYLYTITAGGQAPAPPTVDVTNRRLDNIFPVGTALYATNNISTLALVQSGISSGIAYTVTTSGVSYTLTSIGVSGGYYVLNGGPSTLISLSGQVLSLSVIPISNTFTFPITSVTSIYDGSGNITAYNLQNPSILKSKTTFSGATVYNTTISAIIPFYGGMTPTTFLGTVSSSRFTPTPQAPTFVGPPSNVIITSSAYASQEVRFEVTVSGRINPTLYSYAEISGKILPGTSVSPSIVIRGLTNGSSYTFSISAFGNQVYSPSATRSARFDLCTNAPRNVVASFFNVTPTISYAISDPPSDSYVAELLNNNNVIQSLTQASGGSFNFPNTVNADNIYNFRIYGILNGISSTVCNIPAVIAGPPFTPTKLTTVLTSGQIVFNWSSGKPDYSERFRITEYLSNNGVYPTGGVWSNISGLTYTVSAAVTASGTQAFGTSEWIEVSPGYASFVLNSNVYQNFANTISGKYLSNQIYLTLQQSGGVSYTFPLTNISAYNPFSNIYTNPNYPKETTDIFNPALSLSVTYSYGTGPFNYGKYFYMLDSLANQVYGPSAGISAQMFVQPVNGVPTVSVTGTTATVSFTQTAITGSVYRVTNNYGSNVSAAPYAFTNLSTGRPYTFSVVVSNGAFVSISSASSIPIYVGPPSAPLVSTSYYGTTSTVYVTDTTLSLASVFFDSGKQGTGTNIATPSHTNVIQQASGGFWFGNATGLNGNIKDTLTGFISALADGAGTVAYSNDGIANAMYQFTVTPSTGTMAVSLSSYRLFISGTSLVVSNGSTQVYSATVTASSYPIQFVSRSIAFGIQSGLSSFFYTSVPASSDLLTISLGGAASFSDYRVYSLNNVGVPASSYTITDQNSTVYNPSLAYTVYSLSGITYASNLFNVTQNQTFTLSVRPFGNGVGGPAGTASLYINTPPPQVPFIASLVDTSATVTVGEVSPAPTPPVETYSLIQYSNGNATSTQTQPATPTTYTFRYPSLTNNAKYYFRAYTTRLGVSSELTSSSLTVEAGRPYAFTGLTAALITPNSTIGTYTLSATLNVGANSNGTMTVSLSGNSRVVSQTVQITTSADQQYSFTVSGGAVYTLSSLAVLNSMPQVGPTTTISAVPFPPLSVSLTISTANLGSTYGGIINVTNPSPTTGVTYYYAYSSNNGATVTTPLSTTNTFSASYGSASNYVGYVYSCNVAPLNLLSTASAVTTTCNVFLSAPTSAVATYNGTAINVNWVINSVGSLYYTVREKDGKLPTRTNINTLTTAFTGITGSSYTFEVAAQSDISSGSSVLYSAFTPTTTISLTTLSAAPVTIDYNGNTITLSWANRGLGYVYTVSQMIGPSLGNINQPNPGQNTITIETVPTTFNTYQFAVRTSLNGISGVTSFSPSITLSTAALTNVSQSYIRNTYTVSWSPYSSLLANDTNVPSYLIQEISGKTFSIGNFQNISSYTTLDTSASFTLTNTVSYYSFQVSPSYKGIRGPVTTLSPVYRYVTETVAPLTTYSNVYITVSWYPSVQPDGNLPDRYSVYDTINNTTRDVLGSSNFTVITATNGVSYQFTVTSIYRENSSPTSVAGSTIRVFTPAPTNVVVTNSGPNLLVSWTGSANSPNATYSIRQTIPSDRPVMLSGFSNVGTATSYTSPSAVTTLSDNIFYNFEVLALSNGLSSQVATGTRAFVYTYPPTGVYIYYSNSNLFAGWIPDYRQSNATFNVTAYLDASTTPVGDSKYTAQGASSIFITPATSNLSYYAKVYATNNNLRQSDDEVSSGNTVRLFTAPPIFNGIGFNGNYAITVNLSSGPEATTDRLRNADTYTLTEVNNLFFPNASSWTFRPTEVYTIPTLGTQGLTYNFSLYATLCGLASIVASPSGTRQLRLITNPVPANSVVADYSGTTVTISWGKAVQNNVGDANSDPNGGYTIYVSSQGFPVTSLYNDTSIKFIGTAGSTYQFSIAAVNNNVGSSLTTGASALVTLYKPVVQFLNVTNSGNVTASGVYYAKMILTWLPDSISTSEVTYTGTAFNRGTGRLEATGSTSSNTLMFDGSLNATYDLTVTARYKGINGNPSTVEISNARPILTVEPLINIGNIVTVNYSANEAFSSFDVSIRPTNGGSVISNIITTNAYSSWRVTTSTGGFGYSVSTTAFFNGIPSTTIARTISLTEPAAPASITFRYNNALVSVSWSPVTTNASSYTFTAYDLSADPPILASSQPGLLATSTSFLGILGHTYNVSAFALSSNNITSRGTGTTATIEIPPAPSGSLILSNTGTIVSVSWTTSAGYGYAFYVSNEAQKGTIIYSNLFALPGDTFLGVIGQTYSVSLFQISPSNVTSAGSIANTWKVYQPSIPFVSFTNIGRDNTVTWPQDVEGSNCVFRLTDNYLYSNILFPDPANYTGPSNGWAIGNVGWNTWFSPKDLPGCTLWLDASDPNATGVPAANGTAISTWRDKSGLGCNATAFSSTQYTTPLNTVLTVPGGATSSTITVTVIGGGGGGGAVVNAGFNARGGIATYTFTGVTSGTTITYYVGSGGAAGTSGNHGGTNSYVTIGSTTIYAGGGGGAIGAALENGGNGIGLGGGNGASSYTTNATPGSISSIASPGTPIETYGNAGANGAGRTAGSNGIVVITMQPSVQQALTIISTGLNSRPTMNFNGSSWFTGLTANTGKTLTAFVVLQHPVVTTASFTRFLSMAPATTLDQQVGGILAELTTSTNLVVANGNADSGFPQPNNTPYIMGFQANGTNLIAYLNGTAQPGTASTTNFNITRYRIGSMIDVDTNVYTGKISEVLIYSNALTPVQRAQVENYLYQKWAINVSSTALTHAVPYNTCNVTANYTQVGNYISYTVTTPADETGATNAGRSYIYSVVPSWNGTNGNAVYTDTQSPIQLFKPTTPGGLAATGQGNSFTLTWQSAVIWTSPATIIPSYLLQVGPTTVSGSYPTQSFNVIGNTQTVNGFDSSAGTLTISLTAVTPVGYTNPIYGNPAVLTYTVPSGTTVSIIQSTTNAENLIVTVPGQLLNANSTWFDITATGRNGTTTPANRIRKDYTSTSSNYTVNVSLGYNYTISAYYTMTTAQPTPADPSFPANPNPFPAKTLNVSGITVTHDACTVTLAWSAVVGAERYYVRTNNNGQPASGKFGQEYPSTTTSITITNNGGTPTEQFASNAIYSYIVQAYTLSSNRYNNTLTVFSSNILSDIATSANVQMYIPTNPIVDQLILTQSFANIIASWPALDSYPKDNAADIGTPSYTISCQTFASSVTTTGTTATFGQITPGTSYTISLNTNYKGFWGATATTKTIQTTAPTITSGPTLTNTGEGQIRVTASAATVGFWYLISGTTETLMNSSATSASNQITSNFTAQKATTYARSVKFVTQDTGLSVTSGLLSVTTPNLVVSIPTIADAGATRQFSITLTHTGTPIGGIVWNVTTPVGTTFLSGSTTTNPTTLTYQFTNAAWSTNLSATFTSIVLANNGFTFPYTGANPIFTPPNLNIPTPTLANSAGTLVLAATTTGGCNVNWFWPSYSVVGTATTPATTLTVTYGALGNTGTTYSAGAALSLSFGGYTNSVAQTSLPSFTAPTFSIGTVTFADPSVGTKIIRLTANYGTYSAGTTGGSTIPRWSFPSATSNGGGYTQLTTTGTLNPTTSPATLDYSNTSSGSSYAIAANVISLLYQGISITYGSLLTASSPNIALTVNGTYSGTTLTVSPTNAASLAGNWSLGAITPFNITYYTSPLNTVSTIQGGAKGSTIIVTVIGGGGGGGGGNDSVGGAGGNGAVATYTFTGVTLGSTISYYVGSGGGGGGQAGVYNGGGGGGGGQNSYVTIGSTTIYAGGGGGGGGAIGNVGGGGYSGSAGIGSGGGGGGRGGVGGGGGAGSNGSISTPPAAAGIRVGTYGNGGSGGHVNIGGGVGGVGSNGLVAITMADSYTITQTPANPTAAPTITITPAVVGTTYTVPVNFSYNNDQFTSTGSTNITVTAVTGTAPITAISFTYNGNDATPNGFNVAYTPTFTVSPSAPVSIGCETPVTVDGTYNNFSPRISVTDNTNNVNVQKGLLVQNVLYRLNAAASVNGNLGSLSRWDAVFPGVVQNVVWGSATGSSDKSLSTYNTIYISWTPISPNPSIASQFTYTIYSLDANTSPPSRPSTTVPTGAPSFTGLPCTTSNVQYSLGYDIPSYRLYVGTVYTDPATGRKWYSAASSVISFTYGVAVYNAYGNRTFDVANANTFVNAYVVGGGGGGGGYGFGSCTGGGSGGLAKLEGWRGLQKGDVITIDGPGTGGYAGTSDGVKLFGGAGGARGDGVGTGGFTSSTGAQSGPGANGTATGAGNAGGSRTTLVVSYYFVNGTAGGGGALSKLAVIRNNQDVFILAGSGGAGGGTYDGGGYAQCYGGNGGGFSLVAGGDGTYYTYPQTGDSRVSGGGGRGYSGAVGTTIAGNNGAGGGFYPDRWNGGYGGAAVYGDYGRGGNGGSQAATSGLASSGTNGAAGLSVLYAYYVIPG